MKLSIRYFIYKTKINKKGTCPIRCRITFNKEMKQFSTGVFINPKHWNNKQQIAEPPDKKNTLINKQLSLIENKIRQAFLMLQIKEVTFNVNDIYMLFRGEKLQNEYNVVEYFERGLNES